MIKCVSAFALVTMVCACSTVYETEPTVVSGEFATYELRQKGNVAQVVIRPGQGPFLGRTQELLASQTIESNRIVSQVTGCRPIESASNMVNGLDGLIIIIPLDCS